MRLSVVDRLLCLDRRAIPVVVYLLQRTPELHQIVVAQDLDPALVHQRHDLIQLAEFQHIGLYLVLRDYHHRSQILEVIALFDAAFHSWYLIHQAAHLVGIHIVLDEIRVIEIRMTLPRRGSLQQRGIERSLGHGDDHLGRVKELSAQLEVVGDHVVPVRSGER